MSWPERPRRRQDGTLPMVLLALLVMVIGLSHCSAEARPFRATVPGTVLLVIVNPPAPVTCSRPGWSILYVATGTVYRAESWRFSPSEMVLDMTPALEQCIHVDGFEA